MDKKTCIRIEADIDQINHCRNRIAEMDESVQLLSKVYQLLGNDIRLKILILLREENQLCVCDLSDVLGISISAVSQHLRKLKDNRMIKSNKIAQTIYYSLNEQESKVIQILLDLVLENDKKVVL